MVSNESRGARRRASRRAHVWRGSRPARTARQARGLSRRCLCRWRLRLSPQAPLAAAPLDEPPGERAGRAVVQARPQRKVTVIVRLQTIAKLGILPRDAVAADADAVLPVIHWHRARGQLLPSQESSSAAPSQIAIKSDSATGSERRTDRSSLSRRWAFPRARCGSRPVAAIAAPRGLDARSLGPRPGLHPAQI